MNDSTNDSEKSPVPYIVSVAIIILIVGVGSLTYLYNYVQNKSLAEKNRIAEQNLKATMEERLVAPSILPDSYTTLSAYEKSLLEKLRYSVVNDYYDAVPKLKYYDKKSVLLAIPLKTGGESLVIYNLDNLSKSNKKQMFLSGNAVEGNSYIVAVQKVPSGADNTAYRENFVYYQKGATDFKIISNSTLPESSTYSGQQDGSYTFTFEEEKRILTAPIYSRVSGSDFGKKKATVVFVIS